MGFLYLCTLTAEISGYYLILLFPPEGQLSQGGQMACFPDNKSLYLCTSLIKQTTGTAPDKLTMS